MANELLNKPHILVGNQTSKTGTNTALITPKFSDIRLQDFERHPKNRPQSKQSNPPITRKRSVAIAPTLTRFKEAARQEEKLATINRFYARDVKVIKTNLRSDTSCRLLWKTAR